MVMSRTGAAEEAHLRAGTGKYNEGDTPTNVLTREQGLGRHPLEAHGPLAVGAVTLGFASGRAKIGVERWQINQQPTLIA
jgi:hypothetical protein